MIAPPPPAALTLPLRNARGSARAPVLPPEADPTPRFTADGNAELERHLAHTCARIGAGVRGLIPPARLEAVLLGGGYGRGEGGVLRTPAGDRPYNDLEFYVCIRGNRHLNELRFGHALHVLGEILTPQAGIEVEFKITSLAELSRAPVSMFSYDLLLGHRCIVGSEEQLAGCAHHRAAEEIPLAEATRLLMNRCTGLLLARERLARPVFTGADADFVRRNLAKAELGLGDAVLAAYLQYHWSVRERHRRLERLAAIEPMPWLAEAQRRHASGTEFKLHPGRSTETREELLAAHAPLSALAQSVFLWIEERRLGRGFPSVHAYATHRIDKCPEIPGARRLAVNAKLLGPRALLSRSALRHPRERILHALALLLWEPGVLSSPAQLAVVQGELRTEATSLPGLMDAYLSLWSRVN